MTGLLTLVGFILGGTGLGALLIKLFANSQFEAGKLEEHNAEQAEADEAKKRADDVLAERRDTDDAIGRLRDGNF